MAGKLVADMANRAFRVRAVLMDVDPYGGRAGAQPPGAAELLKAASERISRLYARKLKIALFGRDSAKVLADMSDDVRALCEGMQAADNRAATPAHDLAAVIRRTLVDLEIPAGSALVVSGRPDLLSAAARIGAVTVALKLRADGAKIPTADYTAADLPELETVVRLGLPLSGGKLPNDLLARHFGRISIDDPALLVRPGVGEDTAAVDISGEEVLVIKSDPITFASDAIARYAVLVNANDIATAGAVPRWLLTTLIFPSGSTPSEILQVMDELQAVSRRFQITLCGGHTEISDAVRRPVITGMLAGTVMRRDLVDKARMRPGDRIFITKALAVEGTALIAREFGAKLRQLGMPAAEIDRCRDFLEHLSILSEAYAASTLKSVSAMHDVTEGGLATALTELSWAGGCRLEVDMDAIPVFAETRRVCDLLGIDPLGLIGSGSLLICCRPADGNRLVERVRQTGAAITPIGKALEEGHGVRALQNSRTVAWPQFEADEITRLYGGA